MLLSRSKEMAKPEADASCTCRGVCMGCVVVVGCGVVVCCGGVVVCCGGARVCVVVV